MRKRNLRALREAHNRDRWRELYAPEIDTLQWEAYAAGREDERESQADEAWLDAIAGSQDTEPTSVDAAGTYTD